MPTSLAAMSQYEDVNREIQSFLASRSQSQSNHAPIVNDPLPDIQPLLRSLLDTYTQIRNHLESGSESALKETLLKSDIKMSLVCETLLATLSKTTEEKNSLRAENNQIIKELRTKQENEATKRIQLERVQTELELKKREIDELARLSRDQRRRVEENNQTVQKLKSELAQTRQRVTEMESLKARAAERMEVHEREVNALSKILQERHEEICKLNESKKYEENKNSGAKMRVIELEREIEILVKQAETKENNLVLSNNELSKALNENKEIKKELERHQESCGYYEKLYKSLDKQNAYLNKEMNRLLRNSDQDNSEVYRKKAKKRGRRLKKLEKELQKYKNEQMEVKEETSKESDGLIARIEELTEKNKEYKRKIEELERSIKVNDKINEKVKVYDKPASDSKRYNMNNYRQRVDNIATNTNTNLYGKQMESTACIQPVTNNYRQSYAWHQPDLNYDYTDVPQIFSKNNEVEQRSTADRLFNLEHQYETEVDVGNFVPAQHNEGWLGKNQQLRESKPVREPKESKLVRVAEDEPSAETAKTYHTTSTLKDMMARTDKLQKKFADLESQLANIKEEDTAERLSERVKAYSNNYSTWNVDSNDSDII